MHREFLHLSMKESAHAAVCAWKHLGAFNLTVVKRQVQLSISVARNKQERQVWLTACDIDNLQKKHVDSVA